MDVGGHDSDLLLPPGGLGGGVGGYLALTGGDDSRTVGADEPGFILSF